MRACACVPSCAVYTSVCRRIRIFTTDVTRIISAPSPAVSRGRGVVSRRTQSVRSIVSRREITEAAAFPPRDPTWYTRDVRTNLARGLVLSGRNVIARVRCSPELDRYLTCVACRDELIVAQSGRTFQSLLSVRQNRPRRLSIDKELEFRRASESVKSVDVIVECRL